MQPLAFTTDKMSWSFILSALRRIQAGEAREPSVALNLEAPSCIVLSCIAVEAFVNEVASVTYAFLHKQQRNRPGSKAREGEDKPPERVLEEVSGIRTDSRGSFYERYKRLLCDLDMAKPGCLEDLSSLGKVRDALVHFRECDVPIVEDGNGVIQEGQELPSELKKLQNRHYGGQELLAPPEGSAWTLRLATDSMAAWSLEICLDAIEHVLNELPEGTYRDFARKAYACRDASHDTLFASGKQKLAAWWTGRENAENS
jgi:hypothetical protein